MFYGICISLFKFIFFLFIKQIKRKIMIVVSILLKIYTEIKWKNKRVFQQYFKVFLFL